MYYCLINLLRVINNNKSIDNYISKVNMSGFITYELNIELQLTYRQKFEKNEAAHLQATKQQFLINVVASCHLINQYFGLV